MAPAPPPGNRARRRPRIDPAVRELRRRLDTLETEIHAIEARLEDLGRTLADPALYASNPAEFARLTTLRDALRAEKDAAEERWLSLAEKVEG